ncbi:GNAT family N-acetyltransferase [Enterococcus alcedinis]|uniref:N-acetyltransferase domain-containing protein n=1 Tax=Enterococcus alcedinis TaxID=1274384 RepID=A0A917JDI0_9ENTE|nr:GNAT family N-acetyltransferase [Enterococcus alcedinis]MBP2101394.1 diamine N-acetyltransferase [Enterococcus alcedinis]GGI65213.1 hypothetical protein GCM10011482_08670 [Enterococcus alcedinis]
MIKRINEQTNNISLLAVNHSNSLFGEALHSTPEQVGKNLTLKVSEAIKEAAEIPFAEAYFICLDQEIIGYTAVVFDETIPEPDKRNWLWQFMIDQNYQGKGYASKALALVIDHMFQKAKEKVITLSTKLDNEPALQLYKKFGFIETSEKNGDEIILQKYRDANESND